jgi:Ca-activated chloride channel homolog
MQFLSPYFFLLFLALPILVFCVYATRSKRSIVFSGYQELQKVYRSDSKWYLLQLSMILGVVSIYIILFARPYVSESRELREREGIDIQIVFDVSYSMAASDLKPNRLEVAKKVVSDFVAGLKNDRV